MAREVGSRQRASDDESRVQALLDRVESARERITGDDGPEGVDARTRGDSRSAVDAGEVDIDEDAVESSGDGSFEGVPSTKKKRSKLEKAKAEAKERLSELSESQKEELKKRLEGADIKDATKAGLRAVAPAGNSSRKAGATGTENTKIAKRATDAATVRAPMGGSLRTVGDERVVEDMARAGAAGGSMMGSSSLLFGSPTGEREGPDDGLSGFSFGMNGEDAAVEDENPGFGISITGSESASNGDGESQDAAIGEDLLTFDIDGEDNGGLL